MTVSASSFDDIERAVARGDDQDALRNISAGAASGRISSSEANFWRAFVSSMLEADDERSLRPITIAVQEDDRFAAAWHWMARMSTDVSRRASTSHAIRLQLRRQACTAAVHACRLDAHAPHYWMGLGSALLDEGHPGLAEVCRSRAIREAMLGVDDLDGEAPGQRYFETVVRGRGPSSSELLKIAIL